MNGGETIQLSFGPASNAVTSHLCNLQGLACTSSGDPYGHLLNADDDANANTPLCDPYITHTVQRDTYVPRVLFVDGKNCFSPWPAVLAPHANANANANANTNSTNGGVSGTDTGSHDHSVRVSDTWKGAVHIHHRVPYQNTETTTTNNAETTNQPNQSMNQSMNSNPNGNEQVFLDTTNNSKWNQALNPHQKHAFAQFQNVASTLSTSTSTQSRYHHSR